MARYTGLWQRISIQVGDHDPQETHYVFWLQADRYYADLRIPFTYPGSLTSWDTADLRQLTQAQAFAGTITSGEDWIEWSHKLDLTPNPGGVDRGQVYWDGSDLMEEGTATTDSGSIRYIERWRPQALASDRYYALTLKHQIDLSQEQVTHPRGIRVRVGDWFLQQIDYRDLVDEIKTELSSLSGKELWQALQYQADFGQINPENHWQITFSNWPDRVGRSLAPGWGFLTQQQGDRVIERWISDLCVPMERCWQLGEGDLLS